MSQCADKYLVRDYVRKAVSEDILVPLLGVYGTPDEIPYASLPDSFILKATHGSGWNVVCRSRSTFDFHAASAKLSKYLRTSYYALGREWVYKDLTPRVLCEPLLLDENENLPVDYKLYCCHGEPIFVEVDYSRYRHHTLNLYSLDWQRLHCRKGGYPNNLSASVEPPAALPDMLRIARLLSQPFPFVRVDLYAPDRRVFFGELTFLPGRGVTAFDPVEFDYYYGRFLDLKSIREHIV
jgi:hypothetical protein